MLLDHDECHDTEPVILGGAVVSFREVVDTDRNAPLPDFLPLVSGLVVSFETPWNERERETGEGDNAASLFTSDGRPCEVRLSSYFSKMSEVDVRFLVGLSGRWQYNIRTSVPYSECIIDRLSAAQLVFD